MPSTKQQIQNFIQEENASHRVVVWSKTYCPFCAATKDLLQELSSEHPDLDIVVHEMDQHSQGYIIQQELLKTTGQRTVPNVFVNNQHIGGNDALQRAFQSGELETMLKQEQNLPNKEPKAAKDFVKHLLSSFPGDLAQYPGQEIQPELAKATE